MRRQAALRTLQCPENALCCGLRFRTGLSPPCVHRRASARHFSSTASYLKPDDPAAALDGNGNNTGTANGAAQPKPASGFGKGWGAAPAFKRPAALTSNETQIREALVLKQQAQEKQMREAREAREARERQWQAEREASAAQYRQRASPVSSSHGESAPRGHGQWINRGPEGEAPGYRQNSAPPPRSGQWVNRGPGGEAPGSRQHTAPPPRSGQWVNRGTGGEAPGYRQHTPPASRSGQWVNRGPEGEAPGYRQHTPPPPRSGQWVNRGPEGEAPGRRQHTPPSPGPRGQGQWNNHVPEEGHRHRGQGQRVNHGPEAEAQGDRRRGQGQGQGQGQWINRVPETEGAGYRQHNSPQRGSVAQPHAPRNREEHQRSTSEARPTNGPHVGGTKSVSDAVQTPDAATATATVPIQDTKQMDPEHVQNAWSALMSTKSTATQPTHQRSPQADNNQMPAKKSPAGWSSPRFDPSKVPLPTRQFEQNAYSDPKFTGFRSILEDPNMPAPPPKHDPEAVRAQERAAREEAIQTEELAAEKERAAEQARDFRAENKKARKLMKQGKSPGEEEDGRYKKHDDYDEDYGSHRKGKKGKKEKKKKRVVMKNEAPIPIYLPDFISVGNLADALSIRPGDFLEAIHELGFEDATHDHVLDAETAGLIAAEFHFEPMFDTTDKDLVAAPVPEDTSKLVPRPPVVTIMGHVDHGKTTILDWLRKSSVAASEHGGITQHIGAFSVPMPSGKVLTFLDTPGHAAFLDMRRRGANMTDIVILVVAADDSVKPQTIEAIKHAKEANVPIIVAINKVDKPDINIERVKQDLARHNVHVEDFGGDVQTVCVSGKTGKGMLELEEQTVTLSEMLDHRADPHVNAEGWIIEAATKKGGRVATVLVKRGTLRPGDVIVAGKTWARIRSLRNEAGVQIDEALPGTPVSVDGWREQPGAGSEVIQAPDEQKAKDVVEMRIEKEDTQKTGSDMQAINEARRTEREKREQERQRQQLAEQGINTEEAKATVAGSEDGNSKAIPLLIKTDVSGSLEAVVNSVSAIGNNEVYPTILRSGVGPVGEFDVKHAAMAEGIIVTFGQPTDPEMSRLAQTEGVRILNHTIIYELIDDVKAKLSEYLTPTITTRVLGEAEIAEMFEIKMKQRKTTFIAGCKVKNGLIGRSHKVKVFRGDDIIYDGTLSSLKNVKKDVMEMRKGTECGLSFENWVDFKPGDTIQTYEEISEKRYL